MIAERKKGVLAESCRKASVAELYLTLRVKVKFFESSIPLMIIHGKRIEIKKKFMKFNNDASYELVVKILCAAILNA